LISPTRGWGITDDSFSCLEALGRIYGDTWFQLGDRDLATHIYRTDHLRRGGTLSGATRAIAAALGVRPKVLPMSDDPVRTFVDISGHGPLPFQDYLVRRRGAGHVRRIQYRGITKAKPVRGVLEALRRAQRIVIPPSNPLVSIGPILALSGVRKRCAPLARVAAVSPIVAGAPIKDRSTECCATRPPGLTRRCRPLIPRPRRCLCSR
jgi:LPPG:FO 2-phospho-L-lactate transferase